MCKKFDAMKKKKILLFLPAFFALCFSACNNSNGPAHEHTFDNNTWEYDTEYHWHPSSCGHDVQGSKLRHTFNRSEADPTFESDGLITYTCSTCHYSYTEKGQDKLEHNYSNEWSHNENTHWHACLDAGFENFKKDETTHTFEDSVTSPTHETGGYTTHTCKVCGYSYIDNETNRIAYNVHFDLNGGLSSQQIIEQAVYSFDEIVFSFDCTKDGFNFRGWSYNGTKLYDEHTNKLFNPDLVDDMTFVAIFTQDVKVGVANTNLEAGTINGEGYYPINAYVEVSAIPNDGYYFDGWYADDLLLSNQKTYKFMVATNDVLLIAKWGLIEYTINYVLSGGTNSSNNPTTYTVEDELTLYNPQKTGYTFECWKLDGNVITKISKGTIGDLTITAYFGINSYLVTVSSSNDSKGSVTGGGMYEYKSSVTVTAVPNEYYQFDGWYDGNTFVSGSKVFTFIMPDETVNYVARFSNKNYLLSVETVHHVFGSVMIKGDSGYSNKSSGYFKYEESVTISAYTITEEFGFLGWYDVDENLVSSNAAYTFNMPHNNLQLFARWDVTSFNLTVSPNDVTKGSATGTGVYEYNSEITVVATPLKQCIFKGWFHESIKVSNDISYTFTMPNHDYSLVAYFLTEEEHSQTFATTPLSTYLDGQFLYGIYPQTHVNDSELISKLNSLELTDENGWYFYEGTYYAKTVGKPAVVDIYEPTAFQDGVEIIRGETYWFVCEPICWNVFDKNNGYSAFSEYILDAYSYCTQGTRTIDGQTVYRNNYMYSDIREWLNNDFYSSVFALGNEDLKLATVRNVASTTNRSDNIFACDNTEDKVYLPSYLDMSVYSEGHNYHRTAYTTDWARARGVFYSMFDAVSQYRGYYWTRSPYYDYQKDSTMVCTFDYNGDLQTRYAGYFDIGVRPAITIQVE